MLKMRYLREAVMILLISGVIVSLLHHFLIQPVYIRDNSMGPEYQEGDLIIALRLGKSRYVLGRDTVVVLRPYINNPYKTLRLIVGLPYEKLSFSDGILQIEGLSSKSYQIPLFGSVVASLIDKGSIDPKEYFMITNGQLLEPIGIIDGRYIFGLPKYRIWPPQRIEIL